MTRPPESVGTALLDILVERHQQLLADWDLHLTREEAAGKLLAVYLHFSRGKILRAAASALDEAGCEYESRIVLDMLSQRVQALVCRAKGKG